MTEHPSPEQGRLDRPSAIAAASYLTALSLLVVNVQPVILGALARSYGLSDNELGQVSAVFVGINALASLSVPLWIRRVNWRSLTLASLTAAAISLVAGAALTGFIGFLVMLGVVGAALGLAGAPAFAMLGDTSDPERAYGSSVVFQSVSSAFVAAPLAAFVIPHFGARGLFLALGGLVATGAFVCGWLPRSGRTREVVIQAYAPASLFSAAALPAMLGLLALACFSAGISGVWFFLERIGSARGSSEALIGAVISVCSLATIITSVFVTWMGNRWSSLTYVCAGTAVIVTAYAALRLPGDVVYAGSCIFLALGWGLAQPGYWALIRKVDATSRLFAAAPAAGGIGATLAGGLAGRAIAWGGYDGLVTTCGLLLLVGALCLGAAAALASRRMVRAVA